MFQKKGVGTRYFSRLRRSGRLRRQISLDYYTLPPATQARIHTVAVTVVCVWFPTHLSHTLLSFSGRVGGLARSLCGRRSWSNEFEEVTLVCKALSIESMVGEVFWPESSSSWTAGVACSFCLVLWPSAAAWLSFMLKQERGKRKTENTVTKDDTSHLATCRFCREEQLRELRSTSMNFFLRRRQNNKTVLHSGKRRPSKQGQISSPESALLSPQVAQAHYENPEQHYPT